MQKHGDSGCRRGHDKHEVDVSDEHRRYSIQESRVVEKESDKMFRPNVEYLRNPSDSNKKDPIFFRLILFADIQ